MCFLTFVSSCLLPFLFLLSPSTGQEEIRLRVRYRYFDDYLTHLDVRQQAIINGEKLEVEVAEGSGEVEAEMNDQPSRPLLTRKLPLRTGSTRSKEMTCCMLGQLAGDKGYHCFAKFYASRVMFRNYNRAHNKKIAGLQPRYASKPGIRNPAKESAEKLMRTFTQCVTNRSLIFHKCCHLAATESDPTEMRRRASNRLGNRLR